VVVIPVNELGRIWRELDDAGKVDGRTSVYVDVGTAQDVGGGLCNGQGYIFNKRFKQKFFARQVDIHKFIPFPSSVSTDSFFY